jgi:hypothetical protein
MGPNPVMEGPLHIQGPLQSLSYLVIEVLTQKVGAASPTQGRIMSLMMVCVHLISPSANRPVGRTSNDSQRPLRALTGDYYTRSTQTSHRGTSPIIQTCHMPWIGNAAARCRLKVTVAHLSGAEKS